MSDKPADDVKVPAQKGKDAEEKKDEPSLERHHEMLGMHEDRLKRVEKVLGIKHKPDNMKSEEGKGKEPSYERRRH